MTVEKGRLFSIGQFAALHGVNKKTLMWYDEIGLFCPAVVKENGYRYYTYFQSATLEAILLLRELDVPVARIRSFLDDRSAQSLAALWDEQLDAVRVCGSFAGPCRRRRTKQRRCWSSTQAA